MVDIKIGDLIRYEYGKCGQHEIFEVQEIEEIGKNRFRYMYMGSGFTFGCYKEKIVEVYRRKGNNYELVFPVVIITKEQEYLNHLRNAFAKYYDTKLQHPFNSRLYNFYLGMEQSVLASFNDFCKIFGIQDDIYKENGELNDNSGNE